MEIFAVILASLLSAAVLFILTRLIGNRQISQMSLFDYINGITIGSIGAELATELENPLRPIVAMIVYAAVVLLINHFSEKSIGFRHFINGKATLLFANGVFYRKNLKRAKVDISEFMAQLRINGCFDISELGYALLEANGRISFLLKSDSRPLTPSDIKLTPEKEALNPAVIFDGEILEDNLKSAGYDGHWLDSELARLRVSLGEVMLGEINAEGRLALYTIDAQKTPCAKLD